MTSRGGLVCDPYINRFSRLYVTWEFNLKDGANQGVGLSNAELEGSTTRSVVSTLDGEIPDIELHDICHSHDFHSVGGSTIECSLVEINEQIKVEVGCVDLFRVPVGRIVRQGWHNDLNISSTAIIFPVDGPESVCTNSQGGERAYYFEHA